MRSFSLVLLFTISSTISFSQAIPMLGPNVVWQQLDIAFTDNTMQYWPFEIWTDGDTLINDTQYYHLYKSYNVEYDNDVQGYIREDNGKVYVRMSETPQSNWCVDGGDFPLNEDILLFDNSVDVGDTIDVWYVYNSTDISEIEITYIDTQFISGLDRRVFTFASLPDNPLNITSSWIEGLGSPDGLFSPWCPVSEAWVELLCYSVDNSTIYPEEANCIVGIKEYNLNNQVSIVPNPSDRFISIQNESGSEVLYDITIYDLNGKEFIRQKVRNLDSRIDISMLTSGMYFIHIQFEGGEKAVKKFIKK